MEDRPNGIGACVLVVREDGEFIFLQRKTMDHLFAALRGKYCMWGGGQKEGEDPRQVIVRELYEELSSEIATLIAKVLEENRCGVISATFESERRPRHPQAIYPILLKQSEWAQLVVALEQRDAVREGEPVIMPRSEFENTQKDDFLPCQRDVIKHLLSEL